jgi:la-related protein 1
MDSRGWVPIQLISSFNRVRQLTVDAQLVRDVLTLSTLVEVRDEWVRMNGWEQFVLPDAPPSKVEPPSDFGAQGGRHGEEERYLEVEGEDDDEEDVVFVMGKESEWRPELPRG